MEKKGRGAVSAKEDAAAAFRPDVVGETGKGWGDVESLERIG